VLEKIEGSPQAAFDESRRVLKPGGWAIHANSFFIPLNYAPKDMWRLTPQCLAYLARDFSRIVTVGTRGNTYVPALIAAGFQFQRVPISCFRLLNRLATLNHPNWPCMVWVVAEK
jgi:acyl-ACP thioesterase